MLGLTLGPIIPIRWPRIPPPPPPLPLPPPVPRPVPRPVPPLLLPAPPLLGPPTGLLGFGGNVARASPNVLQLIMGGFHGTVPVPVAHVPVAVGHAIADPDAVPEYHSGIPVANATAEGPVRQRSPFLGPDPTYRLLQVGSPEQPHAEVTLNFPTVPTTPFPDLGPIRRGRSESPGRAHRRTVSSDEDLLDLQAATPRRTGGQRLSSFEEERKELFKKMPPSSQEARGKTADGIRQYRRARSLSRKRGVKFAHDMKEPGTLKPTPPPPPSQAPPAPPAPPAAADAICPRPPDDEASLSEMTYSSNTTTGSTIERIDAIVADFPVVQSEFASIQQGTEDDDEEGSKKPAASEPASAPTTHAQDDDEEMEELEDMPPLSYAQARASFNGDDDDDDDNDDDDDDDTLSGFLRSL